MTSFINNEKSSEKPVSQCSPFEAEPCGAIVDESVLIEELVNNFPEECLENHSLVRFAASFMLRYQKFNMDRAKERLSNYLQWRRRMFGNISYHSITTDEVLGEMISTCVMQTVQPPSGVSAPVMLYIVMRVHDSSKYTALQVIKCMHYLLMCAIRHDVGIAQEGFGVFCNLSDAKFRNFDLDIGRHVAMAVRDVLPLRVIYAVVYNPPFLLHYLVSIITFFFPLKLRQRIRIYSATDGAILLQSELGIPWAMIPLELGGTCHLFTPENHLKHYQDLNVYT